MANRRMFQFRYSLQRDIVELVCKASIGAAGAVTISTTDAKGISSIVKESTAGQYTINLQDSYPALMHVTGMVLNSSASAAPIMQVISEQVVNNTTPKLVVQFLDPSGAAANLDSGSTISVKIMLRNAST